MIYGEEIRLRKAEKDDIQRFVKWFSDPEVREGLSLVLPISIAEEENWFATMLKKPQIEHPLVIETLDKGKWVAIGNCSFHNIDWRNRSTEVGIVLGEKDYWNRGLGTSAMRLMVKIGFQTYNLNRISLMVYESNPRAIRAYEKTGFVREGIQRQGMYKDGKYLDVILMSILRSEWEE